MAEIQSEEALLEAVDVNEQSRLNDSQRLTLIFFMKQNMCLWSNEKYSKEEKQTALKELEEEFEFQYTASELMCVWKSLRTSMLREVKRSKNQKDYNSSWKFYQSTLFLKPALEKSCQKAEEWTDDEKRTVIHFYSGNPSLWNHKLEDYHDKARRQVLLGKLQLSLGKKYTEKEIISTWNNLKTYFERERLREEGSKKSGTGTSQVYQSSWKFIQEMRFVSDGNIEPDTPRSSLDLSTSSTSDDSSPQQLVPRRKRKAGPFMDEETIAKRNLMYDTAIKFMQQPQPVQPTPVPLSDEDLFGQYVSSQLKLILDPQSKLNIKVKINNLFLMQQMETSSCASNQFNNIIPCMGQPNNASYFLNNRGI